MRRRGFLLMLSGLLLIVSSVAGATTYYVSSSEGSDSNDGLSEATPFAKIQKAINTGSAGDTILLKRGDTMVEVPNLIWDKGDTLTIGAYGTGNRPIWTINPGYTFYQIFFHCANEVTITDVSFRSTGSRNHAAFRGYGPKDMLIKDCDFYNLSYGIRVACGSNITAKNCRFELIYWGAYIYYENSADSTLTLDNCEFTGWLAGSVTKNEGGTLNVINTKIHDLTSDETTPLTSPDAFTWPVLGARFYGNTIHVENSVFYNIPVARSRTILQIENVPGAVVTCVHNTFYNISTKVVSDLYTDGPSGFTFTNNIVAGPGVTGDIGIAEADNGSNAKVVEDYNCFYMLDSNFLVGSTPYAIGSNSITGQDPLFKSTDPASADFLKLQTGSPAYSTSGGWYMGAYPVTAASVPGDANGDGKVNVVDLGILATNYGVTGTATWGMGDFNGDTNVNVVDLGILATNYGYGGAAGGGDFSADSAKVFSKDDITTSTVCPVTGLPLIAGLLLAALGLLASSRLEE